MSSENKSFFIKSTVMGTLWVYASQYSGKFINLIVVTILARLLLKEDFGVAGYATVIISFLDFPGLGIGPALIYHKKDEERTNTGFWLAVIIGVIMFFVMFLGAPLVGMYFQDPRAVPVTRLLAFYFPLVAVGVVPSSLLNKDLSFKQKFIPDFVGSLSKGIVSVTMAWMGFGAWSLVSGNLVNTLATSIVLWIVWSSMWRPAFRFETKYVRSLLSYGGSIVSLYALGILLLNVDYLIVGRYLGAAALGVYLLAFRIPELAIKQFYSAIGEVLFPVFTKMREESNDLASGFLTSMRYLAMMTMPMALGLALVSGPVVLTFFGEKWVEAIPILSAISIYTLFRSLYFSAGDVFKAQGRPEIISKLHLLNLVVLVPALLFVVWRYESLVAVAWTQAIVVFLVGFVRLYVAARLLNVRMLRFAKILWPIFLSSIFMGLVVKATLLLLVDAPVIVQLIASILAGALSYSGAIWWLQREIILKAGKTLRTVLTRA